MGGSPFATGALSRAVGAGSSEVPLGLGVVHRRPSPLCPLRIHLAPPTLSIPPHQLHCPHPNSADCCLLAPQNEARPVATSDSTSPRNVSTATPSFQNSLDIISSSLAPSSNGLAFGAFGCRFLSLEATRPSGAKASEEGMGLRLFSLVPLPSLGDSDGRDYEGVECRFSEWQEGGGECSLALRCLD